MLRCPVTDFDYKSHMISRRICVSGDTVSDVDCHRNSLISITEMHKDSDSIYH